jgi:hypothetical protein
MTISELQKDFGALCRPRKASAPRLGNRRGSGALRADKEKRYSTKPYMKNQILQYFITCFRPPVEDGLRVTFSTADAAPRRERKTTFFGVLVPQCIMGSLPMFIFLSYAALWRYVAAPVVRPTTDLEFYQQTGIEVGKWHSTKLPDGLEVRAHFKGVLSDRDKLPTQSNEDGDEWYTTKDDHRWVWMTLPGQSAPAWVDP